MFWLYLCLKANSYISEVKDHNILTIFYEDFIEIRIEKVDDILKKDDTELSYVYFKYCYYKKEDIEKRIKKSPFFKIFLQNNKMSDFFLKYTGDQICVRNNLIEKYILEIEKILNNDMYEVLSIESDFFRNIDVRNETIELIKMWLNNKNVSLNSIFTGFVFFSNVFYFKYLEIMSNIENDQKIKLLRSLVSKFNQSNVYNLAEEMFYGVISSKYKKVIVEISRFDMESIIKSFDAVFYSNYQIKRTISVVYVYIHTDKLISNEICDIILQKKLSDLSTEQLEKLFEKKIVLDDPVLNNLCSTEETFIENVYFNYVNIFEFDIMKSFLKGYAFYNDKIPSSMLLEKLSNVDNWEKLSQKLFNIISDSLTDLIVNRRKYLDWDKNKCVLEDSCLSNGESNNIKEGFFTKRFIKVSKNHNI